MLDSSFADAARPTFSRAVLAVVAILARIAWIASSAGAAHVNLRRMSRWICCCFRHGHAREGAREYYGSDDRNSFHGLDIFPESNQKGGGGLIRLMAARP